MIEKIKSYFCNQQNDLKKQFEHTNMTDSTNASQCPYMSRKMKNENKYQKSQTKNQKVDDQSESQDQKPKGGCPFMSTSNTKKNPGLSLQTEGQKPFNYTGYDEPYVSRYKYYLSANKIDFNMLQKNQSTNKDRQYLNKLPIYVQHTLFYQGEDFKKVRKLQCCSRFLAYQELRQKGNKYFNQKQMQKALEYYQRAMSIFRWLQYYEQQEIKSSRISSNLSQMQSESDSGAQNASKIHLNLADNSSSIHKYESRNEEYDKLRQKYKQFFVIYADNNVREYNGQELNQQADIDMRKSLLIQIYLNMAAVYINLHHYSLAYQIIDDSFMLSNKVSQNYLRRAQSLILKKSCTLKQAYIANKCIVQAIQMKKQQKIFKNSHKNILKMLNISDADEVYANCLQLCKKKISQKQKLYGQIQMRIYQRAKQIHQISINMIKNGKIPQQNMHNNDLKQSTQFQILICMKNKYLKVIQFYTESKKQDQVVLAKKQLQQLLRILTTIDEIWDREILEKNDQLGGINSDKIIKRIKIIKIKMALEIYNTGKYNFSMLQWAIKQIIKKQQAQKKLKKDIQPNQQEQLKQISKQGLNSKIKWALILIPILLILFTFLIAL